MDTGIPWIIADASAALFAGACLTLGTTCFILLSSQTGGSLKQRHLLQIYIVVLLVAVIGYFISHFLFNNVQAIFHPHTRKDLDGHDAIGSALSKVVDFFGAVVISMTDGILVWRCYMVHRAFTGHSSSFWGVIPWAIPAGLWVASSGTGIINCTTDDPLPAAVQFICNALTNVYGTAFITIRLLRYRQMARRCFGNKAPMGKYNSIINILLESAAINVPIAICVAVRNMPTTNVTIAWAIACAIFAPCQGFATILIIYQVALGRAIGQQNREEVTLVMDSKSHDVSKDIQIQLPVA